MVRQLLWNYHNRNLEFLQGINWSHYHPAFQTNNYSHILFSSQWRKQISLCLLRVLFFFFQVMFAVQNRLQAIRICHAKLKDKRRFWNLDLMNHVYRVTVRLGEQKSKSIYINNVTVSTIWNFHDSGTLWWCPKMSERFKGKSQGLAKVGIKRRTLIRVKHGRPFSTSLTRDSHIWPVVTNTTHKKVLTCKQVTITSRCLIPTCLPLVQVAAFVSVTFLLTLSVDLTSPWCAPNLDETLLSKHNVISVQGSWHNDNHSRQISFLWRIIQRDITPKRAKWYFWVYPRHHVQAVNKRPNLNVRHTQHNDGY